MSTRDYEHDGLTVHWDSSLCIHVAACLRHGDGAFDSGRRPWVDLEATDHDTIVTAVEACPTGALRWSREGAGEEPQRPTQVRGIDGGPLLVRGEVALADADGGALAAMPRMALCRCARSDNAPFCDGSHARPEEPRPAPDEADAPDEVCPPQDF